VFHFVKYIEILFFFIVLRGENRTKEITQKIERARKKIGENTINGRALRWFQGKKNIEKGLSLF